MLNNGKFLLSLFLMGFGHSIALADTTGPNAPGNTTSPHCVSTSGNTCFVNDANFVISVTPATDNPGGSGVNPNGYHICRSHDTTSWGGCNETITTNGSTSFTVTGSHRPAPGKRRAYYFRAKDNAGNWGAWNSPLYIQTLEPVVSQVIGNVEAINKIGSIYYVTGWACQTGDPNSISIHLYRNGAAGQGGTYLTAASANLSSDASIAAQCQAAGTNYRFRVPLTYAQVSSFAGQPIYVHGISTQGTGNLAINGSGNHEVPSTVSLSYVTANNSANDLEIPSGLEVTIDQSLNKGILTINGQLKCTDNGTYNIRTEGIMVMGNNAAVECGTSSNPFLGNITFSFKGNRYITNANKPGKEFVAMNGGIIRLHGKTGKSGIYRLDGGVNAGGSYITLDRAANSWEVGDEIVVTSTSYRADENEKLIVDRFDFGKTRVYFNSNLQYKHWGETEVFANGKGNSWTLDERAEVINLTRNIKIMSEDDVHTDNNIGAHMMIMGDNSAAYIDNVEFQRVGQMEHLGRYPFHWHLKGNVSGQYIKNSSIHQSFNRCVTIHGTHYARVEGNSCYDNYGHSFFLESGNERKNTIVGNIGILAKKVPQGRELLVSESKDINIARFPGPATFWISNPDNNVSDNVAVSSAGTGFWMAFHDSLTCELPTDCLPGLPQSRPDRTNTWNFSNNVAHGSKVGITHDGGPNGKSLGNPRNPNDKEVISMTYVPPQTPTLSNLQVYKNSITGIYYRGTHAIYDNNILADNGTSLFFAYSQEVKDSLVVGISNAMELSDIDFLKRWPYGLADELNGVLIYDGPFFMNNVHFAKFSDTPLYRNGVEYTPTVFQLMGGFARNVNLTQGLTFNPQPLRKIDMSRGHTRDGWSDSYTVSIRDLDGTLAGTPNREIRPDHPLNLDPTCTSRSDWSAYICDQVTGHLSFMVRKADNTNNNLGMTFSVRKDSGPTFYHSSFPASPNYNKFSMMLNKPAQYHIENMNWTPLSDKWLELVFTSRHDLNSNGSPNVELSNVVSLNGLPTSCNLYQRNGGNVNSVQVPNRSSLNNLTATSDHGVYRSGNTLYFKLKTFEEWITIANRGRYHIRCH